MKVYNCLSLRVTVCLCLDCVCARRLAKVRPTFITVNNNSKSMETKSIYLLTHYSVYSWRSRICRHPPGSYLQWFLTENSEFHDPDSKEKTHFWGGFFHSHVNLPFQKCFFMSQSEIALFVHRPVHSILGLFVHKPDMIS